MKSIAARGTNTGKISGVFGRSEFVAEITLAIAYQVYIVGLSFDKVCLLMKSFQHLKLRKSQANALLNQLSRQWEEEFDLLCLLLANSLVVNTDETGSSINSVCAFSLREGAGVVLRRTSATRRHCGNFRSGDVRGDCD